MDPNTVPNLERWVFAMLAVGHGSGSRIGDLENAVGWLNRSPRMSIAVGALLLLIWPSWEGKNRQLEPPLRVDSC